MDWAGDRSAAATGARVLGEVEEMSLEEVLNSLRTSLGHTPSKSSQPKPLHLPALDNLIARHRHATQSLPLNVTGRHHELLYRLVAHLLSPPHRQALILVDCEGRFDTTRLACEREDLKHLYLYRPGRGSAEYLLSLVSKAEDFMLYGEHASKAREWWGTVVVGGRGGGDVNAGWKGWLRVERAWVRPFYSGWSLEEAMMERRGREQRVDEMGWVARCAWGEVRFKDSLQEGEGGHGKGKGDIDDAKSK